MAMKMRPLHLTVLSWLLIALGAVEFAVHAANVRWPLTADGVGVPLFELVILVCGVYMLRGQPWARWVALAWIGFHIIVSSLHSVQAAIVHGLLFLVLAWLMFQPEVNAWFRREEPAAR
jgi:hypothetical protein